MYIYMLRTYIYIWPQIWSIYGLEIRPLYIDHTYIYIYTFVLFNVRDYHRTWFSKLTSNSLVPMSIFFLKNKNVNKQIRGLHH